MLETNICHSHPGASLKLFFESHPDSQDLPPIELPLKNGRVTKRLIFSPKWFQRVRIQPIDGEGEFTVKHLRLVWVPPWFAHDRLAQRLANMHPLFRDMPKAKVWAEKKCDHNIVKVVCGISKQATKPEDAAKMTVKLLKDMMAM